MKFPKGVKSVLGSEEEDTLPSYGPAATEEEDVDPFGQIDSLLAALNKGVLTKVAIHRGLHT